MNIICKIFGFKISSFACPSDNVSAVLVFRCFVLVYTLAFVYIILHVHVSRLGAIGPDQTYLVYLNGVTFCVRLLQHFLKGPESVAAIFAVPL